MSDDAKPVFNPETGITENFFGGGPRRPGQPPVPDGPGHGHIDVNEAGEVLYVRDTDIRPR